MGWTVLYIAFGVVALWLLGEVLLQYKARLRWRLLAFCGFLGVVAGVLMSSVVVIGLGAIAFAAGQTFVTLSFRKGYSTGWAIGGRPGASRRRRGREEAAQTDGPRGPALQVSGLEETPAGPDGTGVDPVYQPQPMPDDTNGYGVYTGGFDDPAAGPGDHHPRQDDDFPPYDPYANGPSHPGGPDGMPTPPYDMPDMPGVPAETQQFPAYADPYGDGRPFQTGTYDPVDSFGNPQPYEPDPYYPQQPPHPSAPSYLTDTPPGGVWVPQQRDADLPQPPVDHPFDYDQGPNEQRYPQY
ncbi:hypothetical protein [Streptomyces yaizuensis]|uniref:US12 family protein n=1 Tax=Streptomyces yaizuensis TaxID=2989713 RepID=A0ABQ5NUX6_9ACTN|nr:hypothetical protein [Streptomyces sp. YSPA8]GLF94166.1 US12 family protein [Streptomyces sp. YSPA8]